MFRRQSGPGIGNDVAATRHALADHPGVTNPAVGPLLVCAVREILVVANRIHIACVYCGRIVTVIAAAAASKSKERYKEKFFAFARSFLIPKL